MPSTAHKPVVAAGMQAALWLVVSAAAAVLLGIAFLQLFKHQPHAMTQATIFSQVHVPPSCVLTQGVMSV